MWFPSSPTIKLKLSWWSILGSILPRLCWSSLDFASIFSWFDVTWRLSISGSSCEGVWLKVCPFIWAAEALNPDDGRDACFCRDFRLIYPTLNAYWIWLTIEVMTDAHCSSACTKNSLQQPINKIPCPILELFTSLFEILETNHQVPTIYDAIQISWS